MTESVASSLAAPASEYSSPATCAAICWVLEQLSGSQLRDAYLHVEAVSRGGFGRESYALPVGPRAFVDEPILKLLEDAGEWSTYVGLAARERGASGAPVRLSALWASETLPVTLDADSRPSLPSEGIAQTVARFNQWIAPPSAIVCGGARTQGGGIVLAALYVLTDPIDVRADRAQREALDLMRRLAFAIEADGIGPDVALADLVLPMPGSAVRELPSWYELTSTLLASDRRYMVDEIRAILKES